MENNNMLNTTSGWEEIVNHNAKQRASARERVAARKRERRLNNILLATCFVAVICIASAILGITGAVAGWLSVTVAAVTKALAWFLFGRFVEGKRG